MVPTFASSEQPLPSRIAGSADVLSHAEQLPIADVERILQVSHRLRCKWQSTEAPLHKSEFRDDMQQWFIESAKLTGESVSSGEIDDAIRRYEELFHVPDKPLSPMGSMLAHLYVMRLRVVIAIIAICIGVIVAWIVLFSPGPLTNALMPVRGGTEASSLQRLAWHEFTEQLVDLQGSQLV